MISEQYHTNTTACKTDDAFTALMPTKRSIFFIKLFWDIIHTHTFNIPAFGGSSLLVDVFQEGGWRMSAECAHFIKGVCTNIELLTNFMYSTKYLPMYPLCISITSPDKGHTRNTPRGQYFSTEL
jgi:hypothetical protein